MKTASHRRPGRPINHDIRLRRQEEILDAAARFFASRGYSEANIQELADILEVGKGTIYRYFPTKEALFLAAVDRLMQRLSAAVDQCLLSTSDLIDQIAGAVRTYLRFFAEHPEFTELLIQERAQFKDRKQPTYFAYRDANRERRREQIGAVIAEGRFRDVPIDRIGDVIGDLLYGTIFTNYFAGCNRSPEEQAEDLLDVALFGVLSESERGRRGVT
jgi:AcrR family transcriptional regulator